MVVDEHASIFAQWTANKEGLVVAAFCLLQRMPPSSYAVNCHLCKNCELTIRDSNVAAADLASEVRDDRTNGQLVTHLPMNLDQHFFNTSLYEVRQKNNSRPAFHEKPLFVNEVGPRHLCSTN